MSQKIEDTPLATVSVQSKRLVKEGARRRVIDGPGINVLLDDFIDALKWAKEEKARLCEIARNDGEFEITSTTVTLPAADQHFITVSVHAKEVEA